MKILLTLSITLPILFLIINKIFNLVKNLFIMHITLNVIKQIDSKHWWQFWITKKNLRSTPKLTPFEFGINFKAITLVTDDNLQLATWYIPGTNRAVVILQHGYKYHREEMLPIAKFLNNHGFSVLMADFRHHGHSQGNMITFGKEEVKDVKACLNYLNTLNDIDKNKIAIMGNSMGSVIAILATASFKQIKACIADSPYSSLKVTIELGLINFANIPKFLAKKLVNPIKKNAEKIIGFKVEDVSAMKKIHLISPRPIFIIQPENDTIVGLGQGDKLIKAAKKPKKIWHVFNCEHTKAYILYSKKYEKKIVNFLFKALFKNKA